MENNHINGNPWKGLSSYTYQDADRFYGRDQELKDIALVIKQNAFTTLYGISGAGKTSIINAGLFPLLDKQSFLPIYIRLDHNIGHVPYDMQIIKAVENALVSIDAESEVIVAHQIGSDLDRLWLYFHSHKFWSKDNHIVNPIIFIDQFEEIFTKNDDTENIWSFFNIIDSLQYSTPTERIILAMESEDRFVSFGEEQNFRMVFSMREDFLARLEDYSYNIPALRKNRIGLKPLNGQQALEVILKPRPDMVNRKVALHIISKIVGKNITDNERKLEATSVDTSILSLFCTELYNYAMNDNKGEITIPLVDLYGGNILEWFYDRNMQILPKQTYIYLENQLLTHSGFRNSVALENLLENGVLQEQLDLLAENRIIRIEDVNHNLRVEFTHDVLCKIAKKRKDERDKIEKMKGEKSARLTFTIDCVILFSSFALGLLAIYYAGFDSNIIPTIFSLPFIAFLSMIIIHRTVADKNLSNTIWFIIICIAIEGGVAGGFYGAYDLFETVMKEGLINSIIISLLSLLPLGIILMPFAITCKLSLHDRFPFLKDMKRSALFYLAFLSFQSILLFFWSFYFVQGHNGDERYFMPYLPCFLMPSIFLAMSPIYCLYLNIKKKESKLLSGYSFAYTSYILLSIAIIWLDSENYISLFSDSYSDANFVSIVIIWGAIGILCVFYAVQYMKQPKRQSFTDYYKNVLSFQSFTKYKSLKYRLHTILIYFAIVMMGVIATHYTDFIPFLTLPIAIILLLYSASKEFKFATAKASFPYKIILPTILLSEIIVGSQYLLGKPKMIAVYISAFLITALVFGHLIYKERLRNRIHFFIQLLLFATFVGFLLPIVCLGYNVFNPSLFSVKRVWNGSISSDARNIYFMTISDEIGNVGVMDFSEIIIDPHFPRIAPTCSINTNIVASVYPFRSLLMDVFNIRYRGSRYYSDEDDYSNDIITFYVVHNNDSFLSITGLDFLKYENKYGLAFVNSWLSTYNSSQEKAINILSPDNKCISEKDRKAAIIKLFIKELAEYVSDVSTYEFDNKGNKRIRTYNSDNEVEKTLKTCYNEVTLEPMIMNSYLFTLNQIFQTSANSKYLFDNSAQLEEVVLGRLWDTLQPDSAESVTCEDKAFLYLLLGKKDYAEKLALSYISKNSNNDKALLNLCLSLYCNGKKSQMETALRKFRQYNPDVLSSSSIFYSKLPSKISYLKEKGVINDYDEDSIISTLCHLGFIDRLDYNKCQLIDYSDDGYIESYLYKQYFINFAIDSPVTIMVNGDDSTDLDLYVYDEAGNQVCQDSSSSTDCKCRFIPSVASKYTIRINNLGEWTSNFHLHITQNYEEW